MNKETLLLRNKLSLLLGINSKGQTLMEMVVGLSLITIVITSLAVITTYGLRNSQFSRNQTQATKLAQELLEKVKTIKTSDYGVCFNGGPPGCLRWNEIWGPSDPGFNQINNCNNLPPSTPGCSFSFDNNGCAVTGNQNKPLCLVEDGNSMVLGNGFTGQVIIEHEPTDNSQKRVTARVFWTDTTGDHSSDLVTILTKN